MREIIIASHGSLAEGMHSAARMILGDCPEIKSFGLERYESPMEIYNLVEAIIQKDNTKDYVIFCDINGGSVHNQLTHLCRYPNVYIVCGMNLSMILECKLASEIIDTYELLVQIIESAKNGITIMNHRKAMQEIKKGLEDDKLW